MLNRGQTDGVLHGSPAPALLGLDHFTRGAHERTVQPKSSGGYLPFDPHSTNAPRSSVGQGSGVAHLNRAHGFLMPSLQTGSNTQTRVGRRHE